MRLLFFACVTFASARPAHATCDSYTCTNESRLVGWSADGTYFATIESWGGGARLLYVWDKKLTTVARFGRIADRDVRDEVGNGRRIHGADGQRIRDVRKVDVQTSPELKKYGLLPVKSGWRDAYKTRAKVTRGGSKWFRNQPGMGRGERDQCKTWKLHIDGNHARDFVRDCGEFETSLASARIYGGYIHPTQPLALVKLTYSLEGMAETTRYELVRLTN